MRKTEAFTLIELLVVIAIIGLLASIVIVNVNSARDKAKIAKSKGDFNAFRQALTLYAGDYGTFPCFNEGSVSDCLIPALAPYASNLPTTDPWGTVYAWHSPGCCIDECTMIISAGPNKGMCNGLGGGVGCEHVPSQTGECTRPATGDDDVGLYFGRVRSNQ
jgi:general secretion pathway protein G